ncbi:MAG: hypothetical protein K6T83_00120 [Alicyclobacillus sp.]|nr:hypothetical protein [Alicyclobacillus sp.]
MTHAHPGISPLDFNIKPDDPALSSFSEMARRVYALLYNRALASLAPHPVWEECRRVGQVNETVIAVGWTNDLEPGWTTLLDEQARPATALPSTTTAPSPSLRRVIDVQLEQREAGMDLTALLDVMESEGIGRPSTYEKVLHRLALGDRWFDVDTNGRVAISSVGWEVIRRLETQPSLPPLDSAFTRKFEQSLDAIEHGTLLPSQFFETLDDIVDEAIIGQLHWLDEIGEPLAGEPAEMSYARRDNAPVAVPVTLATPENPETTLPADDPLRSLRAQYIGALVHAAGRTWWKKSMDERGALAVYAIMTTGASLEEEAFAKRLQYDALVRWVLGITKQPTKAQLRSAKYWWETLGDDDMKGRITSIAKDVANALHLGREAK